MHESPSWYKLHGSGGLCKLYVIYRITSASCMDESHGKVVMAGAPFYNMRVDPGLCQLYVIYSATSASCGGRGTVKVRVRVG
jgi:hypothetical protein